MEKGSSQKMMTCRKDMQCTCPMCLASFQATWDLRQPLAPNNAFQPLTNLEDSFNHEFRTPTPPRFRKGKENETPRSEGNDEKICRPGTPFLRRTPSHLFTESMGIGFISHESIENGQSLCKKRMRLKCCTSLVCLLSVAFLLPKLMLEVYPPILSGQEVLETLDESRVMIRLGDRLDLIQRKLAKSLPGQTVSNCTGATAAWRLIDAGYFVHSECKYFASLAESVTVWGFPVKTSGVLNRAGRDRFLTVISGQVIEWREGRPEYEIHNEGRSWILPQWAASAVHLEANTWILEYKGGVFSGLASSSGIAHFLQHTARKLLLDWKAAFDATTMVYSRFTNRTAAKIFPT